MVGQLCTCSGISRERYLAFLEIVPPNDDQEKILCNVCLSGNQEKFRNFKMVEKRFKYAMERNIPDSTAEAPIHS